ncbi:hypothetical protein GUITHDRAFT_113525 [Guillardia theta CCMP2712]|uniref:Uncharacterized protein n=1 Tax=Guillardia theta (strain CCMP2712) TaxID=905079 RepID=L1IW53_GUITC|nr:hypothetical protein GUITHDRAFT_113525 [Guillardia theta CCMP2712]EKX40493.1 hypothetical protein GUITHDRAFT_113525 [Guillardia theta CCMP2712]|eukprot:XP_005827473.1 hypothetical protein GUITHDRAFT_113525 [Guillardia theta CCMP2712]
MGSVQDDASSNAAWAWSLTGSHMNASSTQFKPICTATGSKRARGTGTRRGYRAETAAAAMEEERVSSTNRVLNSRASPSLTSGQTSKGTGGGAAGGEGAREKLMSLIAEALDFHAGEQGGGGGWEGAAEDGEAAGPVDVQALGELLEDVLRRQEQASSKSSHAAAAAALGPSRQGKRRTEGSKGKGKKKSRR